MSDDEPVTQWLRRLEAGDEDAARLVWQRYYRKLIDLARRRLGTTPRRVMDEEDIALSVLRCLCEGAARGQYDGLANREGLWQLLATITGRKLISLQRRLHQHKRGGGRVRGDSVLQGNSREECKAGFDQIGGNGPTPDVLAIASEEYQRLMALLEDERLREVAQCRLDGYSNEEIGERMGLACRSIERKLQRIRQVWGAELGQ